MKSNFLISILFIFFYQIGVSQNDLKPLSTSEFGFNATALISNILPFESSLFANSNDNLLFYKRGNGKTYFRSAINVGYTEREEENSDFTQNLAVLKLGFEIKNRLSKSWVFHSGAEAIGRVISSKTESTDTFAGRFTSKNRNAGFGVAGIYGIQWMINERIALGTEGYLTFMYTESSTEFSFEDGNSNNNKDTIKEVQGNLSLPTSLLLSIYF